MKKVSVSLEVPPLDVEITNMGREFFLFLRNKIGFCTQRERHLIVCE